MSELNATSYDIHLRLQNMLVWDVRSTLSNLKNNLGYLKDSDKQCGDFILSIQDYIDSSQTIINAIIEWNKVQILSDNYSSSLNFQIGLAISFLDDRLSDKRLLIKNNTTDLPGIRFSIPLLKLLFVNLVLYKSQLSNATEVLEIDNYLSGDKLVICLIFPEADENLRDLITCIKEKDFVKDEPQMLLSLCYKFLRFYDCDIWLENPEKGGLKVCFSIPANKND